MENAPSLLELFELIFEEKCTDKDVIQRYCHDKVKLKSFFKGESIVTIFDRSAYSYLVFQGEYSEISYSAKGERNLMALREAPELLGIVAMIEEMPFHGGESVATSNVEALEIENTYFYRELEQNGRLCLLLLRNMSAKLMLASDKIRNRSFLSAKDMFKVYMYEQWKKNGAVEDNFWFIKPNCSIADELGVSERTIYRVLNELKETDEVEVVNGNIYLSRDNIQNIAHFFQSNIEHSLE